MGAFGDGGAAGVGGVGLATDVGIGATKTGSGNTGTFIGGTEGTDWVDGGMTGPCIGVDALSVEGAGDMSLNIDVKLGSAALTGAGDAGADGAECPKRAVNSPTFFFGGSIG
jgi:hypothetical protein